MIRSVGETDTGEVLEQNVKIRDSKGEHECVVCLYNSRYLSGSLVNALKSHYRKEISIPILLTYLLINC